MYFLILKNFSPVLSCSRLKFTTVEGHSFVYVGHDSKHVPWSKASIAPSSKCYIVARHRDVHRLNSPSPVTCTADGVGTKASECQCLQEMRYSASIPSEIFCVQTAPR